ncbi:MAG: hypothetical protein ACJAT4_001532 [Granulosicoccus sp.]|jgi:hypothetical protein
MKTDLLKIAIRQKNISLPKEWIVNKSTSEINETTSVLMANCARLGFSFSEDLLHAINGISPKSKLEIFETLKEVTGINKNWTPLVKQWDIPTGESIVDHVITFFANVFQSKKGTTLPCGHLIPDNTFPLERYNGCPYCGTPFTFGELEYNPSGNKLKMLELWTEADLQKHLLNLLESPVALDATQVDSLKVLVENFEVPKEAKIGIKETMMILLDALVEQNKLAVAGDLFKTPNDVLRYLWYKHTGFLQIIEPKIIAARKVKNTQGFRTSELTMTTEKEQQKNELKLKFTRAECRQYATWLNKLEMKTAKQCEIMHPKRSMWVRVIRALRLAEFSKRKGFENLAELLDLFYNKKYEVWKGKVQHFKLKSDAENTFKLLKQRPGLFARSLFSTMLWFGKDIAIQQFREVMDQVPARLIFTLNMYAEIYFDKNAIRSVKPLGGVSKKIPANKMLNLYSDEELITMQSMIQDLSLDLIIKNFEKTENPNQTIFIDDALKNIPIAIGDRSESVQDLPSALMGTRFPVEGDTVRLFLQWGEGLPAQHLDMDLSCKVAYEDKTEFCSYSQLVIPGCKHSGDIQKIPHQVGTAEYIDIDLKYLADRGAKYVSFTCNAYTSGELTPNLVVGWMNSKSRMKITKKGVAYDPTAVQHQVRIKKSMTKGMVFGILDIQQREVIWLEMGFDGQVVQNMNSIDVKTLLRKLDAKLKIGTLLELKAKVQGLTIVEDAALADEVYDMNWALNTAEVSKLFLS